MTQPVNRPPAVTLVVLVLTLSAIGAFVLAMTAEALASVGARWRLVQVGALLYGVTAVVAAVGLWRLRRWAYVAFVGWVAAVLAIGFWWPAAFPRLTPPAWLGWLWVVLVAAVMLPLGRYLRRAVSRTGAG